MDSDYPIYSNCVLVMDSDSPIYSNCVLVMDSDYPIYSNCVLVMSSDYPIYSNCVLVMNSDYPIYSKCVLVMNSDAIRNMWRIDYSNKLRKKNASCWSLLSNCLNRKYILSYTIFYYYYYSIKSNIYNSNMIITLYDP
jgi:hypothetical protein